MNVYLKLSTYSMCLKIDDDYAIFVTNYQFLKLFPSFWPILLRGLWIWELFQLFVTILFYCIFCTVTIISGTLFNFCQYNNNNFFGVKNRLYDVKICVNLLPLFLVHCLLYSKKDWVHKVDENSKVYRWVEINIFFLFFECVKLWSRYKGR